MSVSVDRDIEHGSPHRILLSVEAAERFGEVIVADAPGAQLVPARPATTLVAPPSIAWFSNDLFAGGRGAGWFASLLLGAEMLEWVHSSTAGLDSPLFGRLAASGVRVTSAHIYATPIAEFVVRAVLDHFQQAGKWREAQRARRWEAADFREVAGSTWLVVGMGSVGSAIAARGRALGAHVIGSRRHPCGSEPADELVAPDRLHAVLDRADVVCLTRPAGSDDAPVVDATFLDVMRSDALLVNVARGNLVDERALLAALDRGAIGAAVLDVFTDEPPADTHAFWDHPRIVVTPHAAGQGSGRYERGAQAFADNLRRFLADEPLPHELTSRAAVRR